MNIYEIEGIRPVISEKAFVHDTAVIIGDVFIDEGVYIGPYATLRGDFGRIIIGRDANIQDGCILHGYTDMDTIVEEKGHIGHGAVLHSCHIKYNAMVGMGAIVMDGAVVGTNAVIGAFSLVLGKMEIPDNYLAMGIPAKIKRELHVSEIEWKSESTQSYRELTERCLTNYSSCIPLRNSSTERENLRFKMDFKPKNKVS